MRIGVDVGGTNTDAVLMDATRVVASSKEPTTADVESGVIAAIGKVLADAQLAPANVGSVMIGTTQFTNALVERAQLDKVGVLRLASPSGEALPPFSGWPEVLAKQVRGDVFLLPGGYEVDGREIASLDEALVRSAAHACRQQGIQSLAISSVFAPMNASMEQRAAEIVQDVYPQAAVSLSSSVGRIGMVERENSVILNAALISLAERVTDSFERALETLKITAPLYISQNDGTLITADRAARYPILTLGSGPTNSMRGAAFLTGLRDAIVMDVGGTTCDIGALTNGFPRESTIAVDIGGVRTNFRMPDILAIGLGGGTCVKTGPGEETGDTESDVQIRLGPESVGYQITQASLIFGGTTLTTSDIAVALGRASFGDASLLSSLDSDVCTRAWNRMQDTLAEGLDRMKTARGDAVIIAVGGASFLIDDDLKGAQKIIRPPHCEVANAVGAAIAQIGARVERIVDFNEVPRDDTIGQLRAEAADRVIAGGGSPESVEIVDIEEVSLSYLPGRSVQLRIKAVGNLTERSPAATGHREAAVAGARHAY